jgi:hypothetical protein
MRKSATQWVARATGMVVTGVPNRRLGPPASSTFSRPALRTEECHRFPIQGAVHLEELHMKKLAEEAGIHRTYLGGIELGLRNPSLRKIARIPHASGFPVAELFQRK